MTKTRQTDFVINRRNIIKNIATLFSGSAIAQFISAITILLTARQLGPEQYGQYTGTMILALFCSIVFSLGFKIWLLQAGGRSPNKIGDLVGSVLAFMVCVGLVWLVAMYFIAEVINSSSMPTELIRLACVIVFIDNLFMVVLTGFKAILCNNVNSILQVASSTLIFFVILYLISTGKKQAAIYMQAQVIVLIISLIFALIIARYYIQIRPSRSSIKLAIIESPPYAISEFLTWTYIRVDVLIIAFVLNDYAVGIYAPAEGIINALYLVPLAINAVMIPVLSKLFSTNINQAWATTRRFIIILFVSGFALFIVLYFGAKYLIYILGSSYANSQEIIQILSIILLLHSVTFGVAAILVATNQQAKRTVIQAIAVVINIGLNFLVINRWGITGVAFVYVFTEFLLLIGYSFLVVRYRKQSFEDIQAITN